jgi:hypothetical protein
MLATSRPERAPVLTPVPFWRFTTAFPSTVCTHLERDGGMRSRLLVHEALRTSPIPTPGCGRDGHSQWHGVPS